MIIKFPPLPGVKREASKKVVDIVRARQERDGVRATHIDTNAYHIVRERWRTVLCEDGKVYIDILHNDAVVTQLDFSNDELQALQRDILQMSAHQKRLNRRQRGANLWIAREHPTQPGWLMVKHNDCETPFRPITCRARRKRRTPGGREWTPNMPVCSACSKQFEPGEQAFEATCAIFQHWGERARICNGCTQPPREGLEEIAGGA